MYMAEQMTGCKFEVERLDRDGSGDTGDGKQEQYNVHQVDTLFVVRASVSPLLNHNLG